MEVLLPDRPKVKSVIEYARRDSVVSPLTAHLYMYFGRKVGYSKNILMKNLALLKFTDLGDSEVRWAIANCQDDDFEDAIQVACAVNYGCEEFVTLNKSLAQKYNKYIRIKLL